MTLFDLRHDPVSCTRVPCGRCRPSGEPRPPKPVDHQVAKPTDQQVETVNRQAAFWRDNVDLWARQGAKMLATADAWVAAPGDLLRGDDGADDEHDEARSESRSDKDRRDAMWQAQAAGYATELATLTKRIGDDLARLKRLHGILRPDQPDRLTSRELLSNKTGDGAWCVSCFRDGGWSEPVWDGRSRDGCQWCARWRTSEGQWPPLALVRWRHRNPGRDLTTRDVARLMGRAS